jgi:hypothetical protein
LNRPNLFASRVKRPPPKIKANVGEIEIHRQFLSTQQASGDNHHIANNLDLAHRSTDKKLIPVFNVAA